MLPETPTAPRKYLRKYLQGAVDVGGSFSARDQLQGSARERFARRIAQRANLQGDLSARAQIHTAQRHAVASVIRCANCRDHTIDAGVIIGFVARRSRVQSAGEIQHARVENTRAVAVAEVATDNQKVTETHIAAVHIENTAQVVAIDGQAIGAIDGQIAINEQFGAIQHDGLRRIENARLEVNGIGFCRDVGRVDRFAQRAIESIATAIIDIGGRIYGCKSPRALRPVWRTTPTNTMRSVQNWWDGVLGIT